MECRGKVENSISRSKKWDIIIRALQATWSKRKMFKRTFLGTTLWEVIKDYRSTRI